MSATCRSNVGSEIWRPLLPQQPIRKSRSYCWACLRVRPRVWLTPRPTRSASLGSCFMAALPAARFIDSIGTIDVTALLGKIRTPTLVLHSRKDAVIPISQGRALAAGIPGAQFVELDSKNHVLLETESAWERFCEEVLEFVGLK